MQIIFLLNLLQIRDKHNGSYPLYLMNLTNLSYLKLKRLIFITVFIIYLKIFNLVSR